MVKFNVEGAQNAEVSVKFPPQMPPEAQLKLMERYTEVHRSFEGRSKELREAACLAVLYPALFRQIEDTDKIIGRMDFLPIGFGCVTSVGGVGHYCVFSGLKKLQKQLPEADGPRIDALYEYWLQHDLKTLYCKDVLTETTVGRFIDCEYPMIATARLSGMMLDYHKLLRLGIGGLRALIEKRLAEEPENCFLEAALQCLDLFVTCADALRAMAAKAMEGASPQRKRELEQICDSLEKIRNNPPETFHQALQLFWLYALLAGVINYGRMDDVLGSYLANDLKAGRLTEEEAYAYLKSLWWLIENRRTTVNGRIIVGGRGRQDPESADQFAMLCMRVAKECRYVEPQFTLRFDHTLSPEMWNAAMDALGAGATYPTLYNDDVNVPAVAYGMRVDEKTAEQYVPFGCTEFVIQGQSVGTPNVCLNVLKILTALVNQGVDPINGRNIAGTVAIPPVQEYKCFQDFYATYQALLDQYMDRSVQAQTYSYQVMNQHVSYLFTSILMDDCLERGKALLEGGVRYLGGTNEIYGLINASDSLWAIKRLVFDTQAYSLAEIRDAALANFQGYSKLRKDLLNADKYGNDLDTADAMAVELYEYIAKGVRQRGIDAGMQYFLVVISNNQMNTDWGLRTAASPDGRLSQLHMNPANNPQSGADKSGPTAMLNSLVKLDPRYHAGSVQNIKITPRLFNRERDKVDALFKTYFEAGGCHLMVTVVDRGVLEDAVKHPEKYPTLLVRVSGFSAVFVNLPPPIQQEVMARMLYDS